MSTECRTVPQSLDRNWKTYQDMYRALVREEKVQDGTPVVPDTFSGSQSFSFMSDQLNDDKNQKRAFNLKLFNDQGARACLLLWAGVKADDIAQIQTVLQNPTTEANGTITEEVEKHLNDGQKSLFKAMRIVASYQQPLIQESGGNKANPEDARDKGDPNLITAYEIEENAGKAVGTFEGADYHQQIKAQTRNIVAVLGLLEYVTTAPAKPMTLAASLTNGGANVVIAPNAQNPFPTGVQIFIDNATTPWAGATIDAASGITIPVGNLPAGEHTITLKNSDGTIFGTAKITTTAAAPANSGATVLPQDGGAPKAAPSGSATVLTDAGAEPINTRTKVDTGGAGGAPIHGNDDGLGWVGPAIFIGVALLYRYRNAIGAGLSSLRERVANAWPKKSETPKDPKPAGGDQPDVDLVKAAEEEARRLAADQAKPADSQPPVVVNATNFLDPSTADKIQVVTPQEHVVEAQIKALYDWAKDSHNTGTVRAMARMAIQQLQSTSRTSGLPVDSHLDLLREERHAAERAGISEGTVRAGVPESFLRKVVELQVTSNGFLMSQLGFGSAADFSQVDAEARNRIESRRAEYHRAMEGFLPRP